MTREHVWLSAWCATANSFNASQEASTRFADACLKAFDERFPALAIEAGTDETLQAAQPVGQERGPQGNAQPQAHKYSMKEEPNGY